MPSDFSVPLGSSATTAAHYAAGAEAPSRAFLVLAHGAGAGHRHPFMTGMAAALSGCGVDVVTFNFPYMEQRRRLPDRTPALESCFRAVLGEVHRLGLPGGRPVFIGGKSMGGRIATHLAAQDVEGVHGVVVLGYPLHPPGTPGQLRSAHLPDIRVPLLILQGERDAFGTPAELEAVLAAARVPATLHVVAGGDHSLAVRGQPPGQIHTDAAVAISRWMDARA